MATIAQLEQALLNADSAGRTDDARVLAIELQRALQGGVGDMPIPSEPVAPQEEAGFLENIGKGFASGA